MRLNGKHRLSTTISREHYKLLQKHAERFGSQQKVIEKAIETLNKEEGPLTKYDIIRKEMITRPDMSILQRKWIKHCIDGDLDGEVYSAMVEYAIVMYKGEPLHELTLKEMVEGLCDMMLASNLFETVNYKENGGGGIIITITHHEGRRYSDYFCDVHEKFFKRCGTLCKSEVSDFYIFHEVSELGLLDRPAQKESRKKVLAHP